MSVPSPLPSSERLGLLAAGNFIVDYVPGTSNAWIAGVGQAEGFKFGPVVGEYVAQRVLGIPGDPKLVAAFKLPTEEYAKPPG